MVNVGILYIRLFGICYVHLVCFMVIWELCGNLVYFPPFWHIVSRKIWQPCFKLLHSNEPVADVASANFEHICLEACLHGK
jgi:hypothetical protein